MFSLFLDPGGAVVIAKKYKLASLPEVRGWSSRVHNRECGQSQSFIIFHMYR